MIERLLALLNHRITPVVPRFGSVGASGDLCPSAYIARAMSGRGDVFCQGVRMPASAALAREGIPPLSLEAKEGLALLNEDMHAEARRRELFFQTCDDIPLTERRIQINGKELLSFSSCSYLGLERHPALIQGVHEAVERYGTQFSASRGYVSAPRYDELEESLSELFGGSALVTSSTSIGHQITLPVLVTEKDAIVMDHQIHYSVQMAGTLLRAAGARVEIVRHSEHARALELVRELAPKYRTVWFACDGVYSMFGDLVPVAFLRELLAIAPNVRLYVDDAHGMSWAGRHGRGSFLSRMPLSERMVVATSLNKAFSASGGCIVFPTQAERERVRICGGPMVFSGPLQPPMLGAALASARVHLSEEITGLQRQLRERVDLFNRLVGQAELPLLVENESPIFFIRLGLPRVAFAVAERMLKEGLYVNVSMYPSVSMKRAGIRIALTTQHSLEDVQRVVAGLARHVPEVMKEQNLSRRELDDLFAHALPPESGKTPRNESASMFLARLISQDTDSTVERTAKPVSGAPGSAVGATELTVEHTRTIHEVDKALWDSTVGGVGACSWDAMAMAEKLFTCQDRPEHNWRFHYVVVRGSDGRPVYVTHFTESLNKDDLLMRPEVSEAVEARRAADPYFLTSVVVMTGSPLSEGNHVYLDRSGPWRPALQRVLEIGQDIYDAAKANVLMLRDLPAGDADMDAFMLDSGFIKAPMLDTHRLEISWSDEEGLAMSLSKRKRQYLREQIERSSLFDVRTHHAGELSPDECKHLHQLYLNVATRKRRINVFELPEGMVEAFLASPAWEVVTLRLKPEAGGPADGAPVGWYAAHVSKDDYAPFLCGLDYRYVLEHGVYRQTLYQMVVHARLRGAKHVHLGMDADVEKGRYGSTPVQNCVYVHVRDHFNGAVLREIVAQVGIAA